MRLSHPGLPHGLTGSATQTRRTVLPWYTGLQRDLNHFDMTEAGTWKDITISYLNIDAAKQTPSSLKNLYKTPLYAFLVATYLTDILSLIHI